MDEVVLPCSRPTLDPLLTENGRFDLIVKFEPDEPLDAVMLCEAADPALAVLPDARGEI